jgi:hypothetical protein
MMRFAVGGLVVAVLAGASGCGSGGSSPGHTAAGAAGPNTQGVLLTVLSYGRAASAKEVCPLLSQGFQKRTGGGDPAKCAKLGQRTLCPCVSQSLQANSVSVVGDKATAKATRTDGTTLALRLVREGTDWKIDSVKPGG